MPFPLKPILLNKTAKELEHISFQDEYRGKPQMKHGHAESKAKKKVPRLLGYKPPRPYLSTTKGLSFMERKASDKKLPAKKENHLELQTRTNSLAVEFIKPDYHS